MEKWHEMRQIRFIKGTGSESQIPALCCSKTFVIFKNK